MDLNGTTQFLDLGVAAIPNSTDFTMTAWTNITGFTGSPGGGGGGGSTVGLLGDGWQTGTSHTVQAGSNRLFVLIIAVKDTSDPTFTSSTYLGSTMSTIGGIKVPDDTNDGYIQMMYHNEATIAGGGSTTISAIWSIAPDNEIFMHAFFENVDQASPIGNTASAQIEEGGPPSNYTFALGAISSTSGDDMVVAGFYDEITGSNEYSPNNSFTERIETGTGSMRCCTIDKQSTGSDDPSVDNIFGSNRCGFGVALSAASGGGGSETSHTIIDLGNETTPYNGPNMHISKATGRIGAFDPGAAATDFSANVTINGSTLLGDWESDISTATPGTFSHSSNPLPVGPDRILVLFTEHENASDTSIVSVTFGGQTMTNDDFVSVNDSGFFQRVELWYLLETGINLATSSSFSVNHTGVVTIGFFYAVFEHINQSTPFGTPVKSSTTVDSTTSFSVGPITGTAGNFLIACCGIGQDRTFSAVDDNFNLHDQAIHTTATGCVLTLPATGSAQTAQCTCTTNSNRSVFIVQEMNVLAHGAWDLVAIRGTKAVSGTVDVSANGRTWTNLITANTSTSWTTGSGSAQSIGRTSKDSASESFTTGAVADIRCYNRQLDQAEITTMYTSRGEDGIVDGLLARWPCKGIIGDTTSPSFVDSRSDEVVAGANISVNVTLLSTQENDLILCAVGSGGIMDGGPHNVTANEGGWTLMNSGETDITGGLEPSDPSVWVFYRLAVSSETTYQFNSDGGSGDTLVIATCIYRSKFPFVFDANSAITIGDSGTPTSPTLSITEPMLVISIAALDDGALSDMTATGTQTLRQISKATASNPNGIQVVVGDVLQAQTSPAQTWNSSVGEWGGITFHFTAGNLSEVSGSTGHPHAAAVQLAPTFIETELR